MTLATRPDEDRAYLGAVYTPGALATWVAYMLAEYAPAGIQTVMDPACGNGALLRAAAEYIPGIKQLVGIDISTDAVDSLRTGVGAAASSILADTLALTGGELPHADAVITNPPWGGVLPRSRGELRAAGFELAKGQVDSWDLFVEWSVKHLPQGTTVAAILPDALFAPEHTDTRRLLVRSTQLKVVARLGEGWFPGVYRGVAVVVYTVGAGNDSNLVRCVRLPHEARKRVLAGSQDLAEAAARVEELALQGQWLNDPDVPLSPSVHSRESPRVGAIETHGGNWLSWVEPGRGIEMGKAGLLIRCCRCGHHFPRPKAEPGPCKVCGSADRWREVDAVTFAKRPPGNEWAPLIVGEDVRRYEAVPSRWVRLGLPGVNYKLSSLYAQPKLLVRKTGLGLQAAVDRTASYTTQVVFHFLPRACCPPFALDYLQGVLCSRVLLAYHLRRSGETEWRSHPYVTPKTLARLPIPTPSPGTDQWHQAQAIAEASAEARRAPASKREPADLVVEELVAGLFHLNEQMCYWVSEVLGSAEELQAFSTVQLPRGATLRAVRAT